VHYGCRNQPTEEVNEMKRQNIELVRGFVQRDPQA
jgi:hypothetical protein